MNGDECVLTVSRSRSSVPGKGVVEGTTKNGQARTICISEEMATVLRCYCYYKMYEAREGGFEMSDYVFTNEYGELIHPDTFSRHLRRLYDENGFPREFHLHTLRHYFVSTMLHNGVDKQTVAELAGHGDTGFLERTYCHPQLQLKRERRSDTRSTFTWRFKLILKKNGLLEKLNVHSLRRSNASLLIANGADVATVAGLLGYSQP